MKNDSLQRRFHDRYLNAPEGKALALYDESGTLHWSTFGEFYGAATERAAELVNHGLRPGDVCILIPENDAFSMTSLMAVLIAGGIPVCASPPVVRGSHSNLSDVLQYLVRKTGATLVIASERVASLIEDLPARYKKVRFLLGETPKPEGLEPGQFEPCFPASTDLSAFQLTSGTTGFPKVCMWNQERVLAALDGMKQAMQLTSDDLCVNWTPLYHDMGLINNFMLCMTQGVPLVMISTFEFVKNPVMWLKTLSETRATITWSPNFGYAIAANWIKDADMEGIRLDTVRAFWNAAERIHFETLHEFHRRFAPYGVSLKSMKTNFGMAENVGGATFTEADEVFRVEHLDSERLYKDGLAVRVDEESSSGSVTVVGVGKPYPGLELKILSRTKEELPDARVGEIAFNSPSRMLGYLNNAKETKRVLSGELLRTGDFGYRRDGELFWLGRIKERINLNGKKFDPSDFEKALLSVESLRKGCFAAFGIPDSHAGTERLVIVAEKRTAAEASDKAIMREVAGKISSQLGIKVSEVVLLSEGSMTKTSSGKRRHRFYKGLYENGQLEAVAELKSA